VLLAIKSVGGESTETWRAALDDLVGRGWGRQTTRGLSSLFCLNMLS
jgi:hypothetical protein